MILFLKMVMQVYPPKTTKILARKRDIEYQLADFIPMKKDFENAVSFFCEPSRQELEGIYIINALRRRKPFTLPFSEFWRILPPRTPSRYTLISFVKLLMNQVSDTAAGKDCDEM